ncbi:MAG: ion channel, partial [Candidatus Angelobacter sp.]
MRTELRLNLHRFRLLKIFTLALLALTAAGTVGFHFIEGWNWFDSFYMVIITLSTIGY